MKRELIASAVRGVAGRDGLLACALVDTDTGMVVHAEGEPSHVQLVEASSDYWRLGRRQREALEVLGKPRAQVLIHEQARVTLAECGDGLLLVSISSEPDRVDWLEWKRGVARVAKAAAGI